MGQRRVSKEANSSLEKIDLAIKVSSILDSNEF